MVLVEKLKEIRSKGEVPEIWFWCEIATNEVDFILENAAGLNAVEAKSGSKFKNEWLNRWRHLRSWHHFQQKINMLYTVAMKP